MADAVATQTLMDGGRNVVMKFTNVSDGTGEAAVLKVDVSTLEAEPRTGRVCTGVKIVGISYTTVGMAVDLLWDATTDVLIYSLAQDMTEDLDFSEFPLWNNAGTGKTGDIMLTTVGHTAGDRYTIILKMRKIY